MAKYLAYLGSQRTPSPKARPPLVHHFFVAPSKKSLVKKKHAPPRLWPGVDGREVNVTIQP